jgi:hypothetical protein
MRRLLGFLILLVLGPLPLKATTLERFTLADLVKNAETIFIGSCVSMTTELHHDRIYSRIRFSVSDVLKGSLAAETELLLPGGSYGGQTERILGMPSFIPEEDVVLFLTSPNEQGHAWPVGLGQGKYRIMRDDNTQMAKVRRNLQGVSFYEPAGAAKASLSAPADIALDAFLKRLKAHIKPQQKAKNDLH